MAKKKADLLDLLAACTCSIELDNLGEGPTDVKLELMAPMECERELQDFIHALLEGITKRNSKTST